MMNDHLLGNELPIRLCALPNSLSRASSELLKGKHFNSSVFNDKKSI